MNKPCAKCNRIVYSMEQLKCLDQVWHKGCFTCDVCNTKLTMKNYKGYDKRPYCNAHYPTTKFTQVADNPEMRRVKANTKTISNIEYHKDLQQQKGKKISVESDPLTDKAKKNTKIQSNLVYHGHEKTREFENAHRPVEKNKQPAKVEYNPMRDLQEAQPAVGGYGHAGGYTTQGGTKYVALYDYKAADNDEISFAEGDFIINPEVIDDGWMTGTVESTGRTGMLPSNYVEKV